jgi:hypothetical protein
MSAYSKFVSDVTGRARVCVLVRASVYAVTSDKFTTVIELGDTAQVARSVWRLSRIWQESVYVPGDRFVTLAPQRCDLPCFTDFFSRIISMLLMAQ